jgi:hypothetical protein
LAKEETIEDKYPPSESSVDEELLDQPAGTEDIIASYLSCGRRRILTKCRTIGRSLEARNWGTF